jgi:DNA polymerase I-like protein with 3'-5' exonuclease and polymerase domains
MVKLADLAEMALRTVREAPLIAYDTETSGLNWNENFPVGYVITVDQVNNFYIPVRHGGGGNLVCPYGGGGEPQAANAPFTVHSFERALAAAFQERIARGYYTVTHNGKFDAHSSATAGILLGRNLYDTGITQALLDEFTKQWGLAEIAKQWGVTPKLGEPMYEHLARMFGGNPDKKQMANFWRTSGIDPMVVDYACGDGLTTLELHKKQMVEIEKQDLEYIHGIESELIWTLFRMERRGMRVDLDECAQLEKVIQSQIEEAAKTLPPKFNTRSPVDMKNYMVSIGRTDWPMTDIGNPSFNEKWLKTFPEGKAILVHRQWSNLVNTFLKPLVEEHVVNGRVHANINQLKGDDFGTISGRLSCSRPNLQQVPKHNKMVAKPLRRVFVPDEGYLFWERDYSQCEPRLFAHYSKEPALIDGYNSTPPKDMHAVVAEMLNVERDPTAKRMNMGILTGMYPKTFAEHMGWTLDMAEDKWNQWFEAFPKVRAFQDLAKSVFTDRGYVKTLLGRRCRMEHRRFAYRATSRIIQGGNADIMKAKLLEIDKFLEAGGDRSHLLMSVHDSVVYQTPDTEDGRKDSEEIGRIMNDVQTAPYNLTVPFKTDVHSGKNWSEATFGS